MLVLVGAILRRCGLRIGLDVQPCALLIERVFVPIELRLGTARRVLDRGTHVRIDDGPVARAELVARQFVHAVDLRCSFGQRHGGKRRHGDDLVELQRLQDFGRHVHDAGLRDVE